MAETAYILMGKKFYIAFFICFSYFFCTSPLRAQNLVLNGSFEKCFQCPTGITLFNLKNVKDWFQPTMGSVDYYNECSKGEVGVPQNIEGFQYPKTGKAYIGMIFYAKNGGREYFSTKLAHSLNKNTTYIIKLNVCLAGRSPYAISDIQVLFTPDIIHEETVKRINYLPQLSHSADSTITDTINWTEIKWKYVATGNEKYLTIGNFNKNNKTKVKRLSTPLGTDNPKLFDYYLDAYYYIDDVCVAEMKSDSTCDCEEDGRKDTVKKITIKTDIATVKPLKQLAIEANKNVVLDNVVFETDKSAILPSSFDELNQLVAYLQKNATTKIIISGYTDNTGTPEKNLLLSTSRAKAVADYLISKGIDKLRVSYKGYGSANPIASNDTEEGKAKNRRVEFKIGNK